MVTPRESAIESDTCSYAEDTYGFIAIKLTSSNSRNGLPDRLFIGYNSSIFFIEFKREDEEPRALQSYYIKLLRLMGFRVYVVDTKKEGREIIDKEVKLYKETKFLKKKKRSKKG